MRASIIGISLSIMILCPHAYSDGDVVSDSVSIVAECNKVARVSWEYASCLKQPGHGNFYERESIKKRLERTLAEADIEIQSNIVRLFEELGSFEAVVEKTKDIMIWREFPKDIDDAKRMAFYFGLESKHQSKLIINYMFLPGKDNDASYLFQNSFYGHDSRTIPSTYVIMLSDRGVFRHELFSDYFPTTLPPCPLGPVKWRDGQSDVLIIDGPAGSGSFSNYYLYSYNTLRNVWERERQIAETQVLVDYAYHEDGNQLRYKRFDPYRSCPEYYKGPYEPNCVEEVIMELCYPNSPVKLEIMAMQDVKYTRDHAPVKIEFSNTGSETAYVGDSSSDYLGCFKVKLHKDDGTQVVNVPRLIVEKSLEAEVFHINPGEKAVFSIDIAELYNTNRLTPGAYKLNLTYLLEKPVTSKSFSGMLRSNVIDFVIEGQ